jgi:PAS domain S-box-containing protein
MGEGPVPADAKISFLKPVAGLDWIVGASVSLEEVETTVTTMRERLNAQVMKDILRTVLILAGVIVLVMIAVYLFFAKLRQNLEQFLQFFRRAETRAASIPLETLHFRELQDLADAANSLVTKRNAAEKALAESEERFNLALDSVSDAVWDWNVETGEVYFSPRWYTMLGYEPNELPQEFETWESLLHPDDLSYAVQTVSQHLESGEPFEVEFRMRTKNNQ